MVDGTTAAARLERLLHVLPSAARKDGASLTRLAAELRTTPERIIEDINQVTARAYYHPGGWPDDVQILVEADRVRVLRGEAFERPPRLTGPETLCLALALRGTSAASDLGAPEARTKLLRRVEERLARARWTEAPGQVFAAPDLEPDTSEVRREVLDAARERRACTIVYVKAGASEPTARVIHPYAIYHAEGSWYVVGHCTLRGDVRVFRMDRILEAIRTGNTFEIPDDFDAGDYADAGRVYRADEPRQVRVRYSARVARWVREEAMHQGGSLAEEPDGSVVRELRVADPRWVVEHTLRYGPDAEIVEPRDLRALVREVAEKLAV